MAILAFITKINSFRFLKNLVIRRILKKGFVNPMEYNLYKYWNHFHEFVENDKGVLVKDTVDYELPLGFLGTIAHSVMVNSKLESIFNFREQYLDQKFNK